MICVCSAEFSSIYYRRNVPGAVPKQSPVSTRSVASTLFQSDADVVHLDHSTYFLRINYSGQDVAHQGGSSIRLPEALLRDTCVLLGTNDASAE